MEKQKIHIKQNPIIRMKVKEIHSVIPNDYNNLENLPTINDVILSGKLTEKELELLSSVDSKYTLQSLATLGETGSIIVLNGKAPVKMNLKDLLDVIKAIDNSQSIVVKDDGDIEMSILPDLFYHFTGEITHLDLSLAASVTGRENEYKGQFSVGELVPSVVFSDSISWIGGEFPELETGKTYQFSVINNIGVIIGI